MGIEPAPCIHKTQVIDFMLRQTRPKRSKRRTEVRGGYAEGRVADRWYESFGAGFSKKEDSPWGLSVSHYAQHFFE